MWSSPGRRARRACRPPLRRAVERLAADRARSARRAGARARARPRPRAGSAPPRRRRARAPAARPARGSGWTRRRRSRWSWIRGARVAGIGADEAPQGRERLLDAAVRLHRARGDRQRAHRAHRDGGGRLRRRSCTTTSPRATPCSRRRSSTPTSAPATCASPPSRRAARRPPQRLAAMIDQCLPHRSRAARRLRAVGRAVAAQRAAIRRCGPTAARLYARLHAWFAQALADGVASGELRDCDVTQMADRLLALIDGYGIRVLDRRPARCRSSARGPRSGRRSRATSACA